MGIINLKGNENILTKDVNKVYQVLSGVAVVYLVHIGDGGISGKKYYLFEIDNSSIIRNIPSVDINHDGLGEWCFLITAIDSTELLEINCNNMEEMFFYKCNIAQLLTIDNHHSIEEIDSEIFEYVQKMIVAEEITILKMERQKQKNKQWMFKTIIEAFHQDNENEVKSKNQLYEAVRIICNRMDIEIASYEKIAEHYGNYFSLEKLSQLSNFIIRKINLEPDWFKENCGFLLLYKDRGAICNPVACIPVKGKQYIEYEFHGDKYEKRIVTKEVAEQYLNSGYVINKAFPEKKIDMKDVFVFVLKQIHVKDLILYILMTVIGTLIALGLPFMNQILYDRYLILGDVNSFLKIGCLFLSIAIVDLSLTIVRNFISFRMENEIEVSLYHAFVHRIFHLPASEYQTYDSADLIKRTLSMPTVITNLVSKFIMSVISVIYVIVFFSVMYHYSKEMTIVGTGLTAINVFFTLLFNFMSQKYELKIIQLKTKATSIMYQALLGIEKIKNACADNQILYKYFENYVEEKKKKSKQERLKYLGKEVQIFIGSICLIIFYLIMFDSNKLTIGKFLGFYMIFQLFSLFVLQFIDFFLEVERSKSTIALGKPILQIIPEETENVQLIDKVSGKIEISHISFTYKKSEKKVLDDISFSVKKGDYLGIVGSSGSGKSTLLKLLLGFIKPDSGKVYYDDMDLELLNKKELRKLFGVVLQDGQLLPDSIFENIVVASSAITMEDRKEELKRVWEILEQIGLADDVNRMPMGLQTMASGGLSTISGGQKQRILIARAIYNKPAILFFDEATSALDNVTQKLVSESLKSLHVTRIAIAHRLSTVKECDKILVLNHGKIVESGTYSELMKNKGYFYELSQRQVG